MLKRPKIQNNEVVKVCDVLQKFGKYQVIQYIYICFPMILVAMSNLNYIFVAGDVKYRCSIPECDSSNSNYTVLWPGHWWPNHTDQCTKPILNQTHIAVGECSKSSFTETTEKCTDWIYENHDTIVSELKLACQPWKKNLVGTVHSLGMAVAMITAGWMADKLGRKPTLLICTLGCIVGNLKTLASNYTTYITIEFLEAAISGGAFTVGAILVFEITGNKNRVLAGVVLACAIYLGEAMLAIIAIAIRHWRTLIYVICSPAILFLFFIKLGNESPRWLVIKGKAIQAKTILKDIAETNQIIIDEEDFKNIDKEKLKALFSIKKAINKQGLVKAFQCKELLLRFAVASFCRFSVSFIYYGLLASSVVLPGDKYTNFLLAAVMSFPGEIISMYFINKFGRKLPIMIEFLLCGIACVGCGYASEIWLKTVLFLFGKFVASACFTGVITYTLELFPTSVRGSLIGLCTLSSSLGSMLAPLTVSLSPVVVSLLFGCVALIASGLLCFTPETKGLSLLDTIEQVADSVAIQNLRYTPCETLLLEQPQ